MRSLNVKLILKLTLLGTLALACRSGPVSRPAHAPTGTALVERLVAHRRLVQTLRAEARVTYWDEARNDRAKATVLFWASRDGRLRMDIDSPVGMVATVATDSHLLSLLDTRTDRFYRGAASACALGQFLPFALPPSYVIDALLGDAPLPDETMLGGNNSPEVRWDGERGIWLLTFLSHTPAADGQRGTPATSSQDMSGERTTLGFSTDLVLVFAEVMANTSPGSPKGNLRYRLWHEKVGMVNGVPIPERSRLELANGKDVTFDRRDMLANQAPPPNAFSLTPPPGLPITPLPCPDASEPTP